MKTITLHQPWASLVALGVKTIETRSWSTTYRGPLAIHAAQRDPSVFEVGDFYVGREDIGAPWWLYGEHGVWPMPFGSVIATCELVDVIPMFVEWGDYFERAPIGALGEGPMLYVGDLPGLQIVTPIDTHAGRTEGVEEQRPYGDFAPGRFAWILEKIEPIDPVAARGRQGLWEWDR